MAALERVHHTSFTVSDLERSLAFYEGLLGCEIVATQEKKGGYLAAIVGDPSAHVRMAHLRVPGTEHLLELFEYVTPDGTAVDLKPWNIGVSHICFIVDDLPALYAALLDRGVQSFVSPPVEVDTGVNAGGYALYLRDPDGVIVELFQPPMGEHV